MNNKRVLYVVLMLGGMLLGFGKWILFSWVLQPSEFGTYTAVITTIAFSAYFGLFGLNEYVIKKGSSLAGRGDYSGVHAIRDDVLVVSGLNSLLVVVVALTLLHFTSNMRFTFEHYFLFSGILIVTVIFNAADASLRATLRPFPFAAMVFIRSALIVFFGFPLARYYGLSGVFLAELTSAAIALVFAFCIAGPSPRFSTSVFSITRFTQYLRFGFSFLWLQVLRYFSFVVDKWFVGWFAGAVALGYYSFLSITFLAFVGLAGIYNAVIIPRVIARFGGGSSVEDLFDATVNQAFIFIGTSILFSPVYVGIALFTIENLLPEYNFDGIMLCIAAIYLGSVMHVSHGFFDSFFYSLDLQRELIIVAGSALIVFISLYLAVGLWKAEVYLFCVAFFVAKFILFVATFTAVLVGKRNTHARIGN